MSWVNEQNKERKLNDNKAVGAAYENAINAVLGGQYSFTDDLDAIDQILKYYNISPVKIPDSVITTEEKIDAVCRITGMMRRSVTLKKGWYKNAFGAFLARRESDNKYIAVIQDKFGHYYYRDETLHKTIRINRNTQHLLKTEAVNFYRPLPNKELTASDLLKFGISSWSLSDVLCMAASILFVTLIGLFTPKLNYFLLSNVAEEKSLSLLLSTVIFLFFASFSSLLFSSVKSLFGQRMVEKSSKTVKCAIMMRVLSLPVKFFRNYASGEMYQRMAYMESASASAVNTLFSVSLSTLFSLVYFKQIFDYTPVLVTPALIIMLANVAFSVLIALLQIKTVKKRLQATTKNAGLALSMISGVQKIKLSGSEKRFFARWLSSFAQEIRITYNPPMILKINTTIAMAITLLGNFIMYFIAANHSVASANYYAFNSAYGMVSSAVSALVSIAIGFAELKPSLDMAKPILETVPETNETLLKVDKLKGGIELNNVSFSYEKYAPNIINNLSLKIRAGEYVAIVGKTGCGKSTLVRLLLGFETPQTGAIYYDGNDLEQLEKGSLRSKIGTVMQDDKLFLGDIYSNIVICAPELPVEKAWEAAELAGIADDIRRMPMGMHTMISENGGISGGQRQRLMIARAVASSPRILIFDEATSALDNITQKKVSDALDSLKCTRIVIAHRLSTIRNCDRILVLDKGAIIEEGTYEELIKQDGFFAELVKRQREDV